MMLSAKKRMLKVKWLLWLLPLLSFPLRGWSDLSPSLPYYNRADGVAIRASEFGDLLGVSLDSLQLMAVSPEEKRPRSIPLQIDERLNSGALVFPGSRLPGTGVLTSQDEVVFMAHDAGQRVALEDLPRPVRMVKEIELEDPLSHEQRYVYLISYPIPPLYKPLPYVTYDSRERSVYGASYFLNYDYSEKNPLRAYWLANQLSLSWSAPPPKTAYAAFSVAADSGGPADLTPNVLKGEFLDVHLRSFGNLFEWHLDLRDLNAREVGFISGPVRAVRKLRLHPKLAMGLNVAPVTVTQMFYDRYAVTQISAEATTAVYSFFSEIMATFGGELSDDFEYEIQPMVALAGMPGQMSVIKVISREAAHPESAKTAFTMIGVRSESNVQRSLKQVAAVSGQITPASGEFNSTPQFPGQKKNFLAFRLNVKELGAKKLEFEIHQAFPRHEEEIKILSAVYDSPIQYRVSTVKQDIVFDLHR